MKKFFQSVGRFLKKNYWIEPLALVVIVFAIVFSLEGVSNVWGAIKGFFSPNSNCRKCDKVTVKTANEAIAEIKGKEGEVVYVYYYEKATEDNMIEDANEAMNSIIKAVNEGKTRKEKVVVYAVNYSIKETSDITGDILKFKDRKMDETSYDQVAIDVNAYLEKLDKEVDANETNSYTEFNQIVVPTPTLVCYVGTSSGYEVKCALRGVSEITSNDKKNLTYCLEQKWTKLGSNYIAD